ncbi:hypothetical protein QTP88_003777 [Uroleucon formosanum]
MAARVTSQCSDYIDAKRKFIPRAKGTTQSVLNDKSYMIYYILQRSRNGVRDVCRKLGGVDELRDKGLEKKQPLRLNGVEWRPAYAVVTSPLCARTHERVYVYQLDPLGILVSKSNNNSNNNNTRRKTCAAGPLTVVNHHDQNIQKIKTASAVVLLKQL